MDIKMAERLMELRKKHGYSQEDLADKLSISRQAVSKWERAESSPDTDNLIALSKLYGISIDAMLYGTSMDTELHCDKGSNSLEGFRVSDVEADEFLRVHRRGGIIIGIGIMFIFAAIILTLILLELVGNDGLGLTVFIVLLAVGVALILFGITPLARFKYLERTKKGISLTEHKQSELIEKQRKFVPQFNILLIVSICAVLLSVIPSVVFQSIIAIIITLSTIALAAFTIASICLEYSAYEKLLGKKNQNRE